MATLDMQRLNSFTKYPSIPTYHRLGEKGALLEERNVVFPEDEDLGRHHLPGQKVILTEKVDGTNGRIIVLPGGDYFIGSREELLYARGDRIGNPAQQIVETLKPIAEQVALDGGLVESLAVLYLEVYGGKTTAAAKNYSATGALGARLFDAMLVPGEELEVLLSRTPEEIAAWRDNGGQFFAGEEALSNLSAEFDLRLTPRIDGPPPPEHIKDTHAWLKERITATRAALGDTEPGKAEGIVARTADRKHICKIRFEDYERAARRGGR